MVSPRVLFTSQMVLSSAQRGVVTVLYCLASAFIQITAHMYRSVHLRMDFPDGQIACVQRKQIQFCPIDWLQNFLRITMDKTKTVRKLAITLTTCCHSLTSY